MKYIWYSPQKSNYPLNIALLFQDCKSPKAVDMYLGNANRSHSVKRHFGDVEQLLPSQKSFKRHKSFDISRQTYGLHNGTVYDGYIEKRRLPSSLPTVQGKHRDLNAISADTVNIIFAIIPNHSDSFSLFKTLTIKSQQPL